MSQLMVRMVVMPTRFRPDDEDNGDIAPLGMTMDDVPALHAFYRRYGNIPFTLNQLANGPFYAVKAEGEIVAAGGTHTYSVRYGIGAMGGILTRPDARGRGNARAVTSTVTRDLLRMGVQKVILNVAASNTPARHVYTRLGYEE